MLRRFKSTLHRVVSTSSKPRLSCACFFNPDFDTVSFGWCSVRSAAPVHVVLANAMHPVLPAG
jgi:isopenicillin N synthase-like dioxygenase